MIVHRKYFWKVLLVYVLLVDNRFDYEISLVNQYFTLTSHASLLLLVHDNQQRTHGHGLAGADKRNCITQRLLYFMLRNLSI